MNGVGYSSSFAPQLLYGNLPFEFRFIESAQLDVGVIRDEAVNL
jgi:hypothetical protein